jgi:hypothetical protein
VIMGLADIVKSLIRNIKEEFPSSTAAVIVYTPIKAFTEKSAQMSDLVSMISRISAVPITCIEIPLLLSGRKYYHKLVRIKEDTSQNKIDLQDKIYASTLTAAINPLVYYFVSGERNGWKIAGATLGGMALNALLVKPALYLMDVSKDLMGYQTMADARKRRGIPKELSKNVYINNVQEFIRQKALYFEGWLSHKSSSTKKKYLALMMAGSLAVTAAIYALSPDYEPAQQSKIDKTKISIVSNSYHDTEKQIAH